VLLNVIAAVPLLIWLYLLFGRGGFWRVSRHLVKTPPVPSRQQKRIVVVIPARDEAAGIAAAVTSLLTQTYSPPLHLIVVDDHSTDGTADVARSAAARIGKSDHLTVIAGQPLPPSWTGKLWAVSQGVHRALLLSPDYLLFTDADIHHGPDSVAQLAAIAESGNYDLASYMVKLACLTTAEQALIPAFVYFFLELYPPAWIASQTKSTAGAAGGCILIRKDTLQKIGGIATIRSQVIDDCALAQAAKRRGGRVWLGLTGHAFSFRSYATFSEIGKMISRTAFNQLHHSSLLLVGTVLGLSFTYLLPPIMLLTGLFTGHPVALSLGLIAWLIMSLTYLPMVRFYKVSIFWSVALPAIAAFYTGATIRSAVQYWRGQGGEWKGRVQDVRAR
jgi:hopene-associated glycosyltransferase HpnB